MATGDLIIRDSAVAAAPKSTEVSGAADMVLLAVTADIDGSGAAGAYLPTLEIVAPNGVVTARIPADSVAVGGSAEVTWAPFLGKEQEPDLFPRNLGELGFDGSGTLGTTYTLPVAFEDAQPGDRIFVSANAPSVPAAAAPEGDADDCTDSQGNVYNFLVRFFWEAFPPNVNEGARQSFYVSEPLTAPLVAGIDTITATWNNPVYDRSIYAWLIRHDSGANEPIGTAATADNDLAVYAANKVTLTSPLTAIARDNGLLMSTILAVKAGGVGGFGGVVGYSGFFQAQFRVFIGSKQHYLFNVSTHGADVYLVVGSGKPQFELDLGTLPGGVAVPAFNGVGQFYTAGTNAWKGAAIFAID